MSLGTRVAIGVAVVVTVVVGMVGVSVYRATETELLQEIDDDLLERARLVGADRGRFGGPLLGSRGRRSPERLDLFGPLVSFDALARVVDEHGVVLLTLADEFDVPSDPALFAAAAQGPVLHDASGSGADLRVVTVASPDGTFIQIARPLDEVDAVLGDLRNRILVIGVVAIAVASALAWIASRRTLRPVTKLTVAAARVAETGDLSQPIEGSGADEVGRLAASFRTMLGALSESRERQHRLVMDASHELRTPLMSMRTNVDVLGRGHDLSAGDRDAVVADLDAELGELSELVAELVDLAADVRHDETPEPLRLEDLVVGAVERGSRRTGRDITLDVRGSVVVEGRPESLTRVVRNLIDNAAKFSPAGSPIRVEVDRGTVVVHDRGPGIPIADRELVFERFHRLESTRERPGSGLGLAIVRQVVDAHGGRVWVDGSPDGGAAVGFEIPAIDD